LRGFTGQPENTLLVLGMRRSPALAASKVNTSNAVAICTSVGFRYHDIASYISAAEIVTPDILIGPSDLIYGPQSVKRVEKMCDRTSRWMESAIVARQRVALDTKETTPRYSIFGPVLPLPVDRQWTYLTDLADMTPHLAGLAVYDPSTMPHLGEPLYRLPRLSLSPPSSPNALLEQISLGADILTIPFITAASDAGIALSFTFSTPRPDSSTTISPEPVSERLPLGIDLWLPTHSTSTTPLTPSCACYACTAHHRAYIQHLLSAKEMLGWTLLQIHNHAVLDRFFEDVRASLAGGTFDEERAVFEETYESDLPAKTGAGPRVRGYHYKSEQGQEKRNKSTYAKLVVENVSPARGGGVDMTVDTLVEAKMSIANIDGMDLDDHGMDGVR
jgi:queuine tRNA-ribosyltransferase